nr:MAG TPA: hypothetical protein [Caudoviricetes sp.]
MDEIPCIVWNCARNNYCHSCDLFFVVGDVCGFCLGDLQTVRI